jgi:hypothetical protein
LAVPWRAQRAGVSKTCTDGKSVRADHRLRADDETIRTQATIFDKPILPHLEIGSQKRIGSL